MGSRRSQALADAMRGPREFHARARAARQQLDRDIADFMFATPHEMPLAGFVDALRDWSTPLHRAWFDYRTNDPGAQAAVASALQQRTGIPFDSTDIALTNGGAAALSVGLKSIADPGDEVIFNVPSWYCYVPLVVEAGLVPVPVPVAPSTFDLDLDAIQSAITTRTRVIVVNTPHNPTGRVYQSAALRELATVLKRESRRNGRTLFVLSDEVYSRLVFDGRRFYSPAEFYPDTLVAYSYSKVLMTPGQRIGYLAVHPEAAGRAELHERIPATQIAAGWAFPNALLQYALPDLEPLAVDVGTLQRKRDRLVGALRSIGYEVPLPESTFFVLAKSPRGDDEAFAALLADHGVLVLPGSVFELPGYLRISLTTSDDTIERGLSGFASAWAQEMESCGCRSEVPLADAC